MTKRQFALIFNRALAWSLIVLPTAQMLLLSDLWHSIMLDLSVITMHGVLSIWLFSKPVVTQDKKWSLPWLSVGAFELWSDHTAWRSGWRAAVLLLRTTPVFALLSAISWGATISSSQLKTIYPEAGRYLYWFAQQVSFIFNYCYIGINVLLGLVLAWAMVVHVGIASNVAAKRRGQNHMQAYATSTFASVGFIGYGLYAFLEHLWGRTGFIGYRLTIFLEHLWSKL
jgi:hypothetical protein